MSTNLATRLFQAVRAAGVAAVSVSIGAEANKATWTVQPTALQPSAQPTIDAFDPNAAAVVNAELDAQITQQLDDERLISAVVWTIIDTYSAPATIAKYTNARAKIVAVYKSQPWKP